MQKNVHSKLLFKFHIYVIRTALIYGTHEGQLSVIATI